MWCWRRFLRVIGTARRPNQSILKEISPEYSLKGLMLKFKIQYFGHLMWKTDSLEKTLMLGKIEGRRRRDDREWVGWMASLTRWTWLEKALGVGDGQGSLVCCSSCGCKDLDMTVCAGCDGPRKSVVVRSYPSPKVRGGSQEELPHVQGQGQMPRGAGPRRGQGQRPREATSCPRRSGYPDAGGSRGATPLSRSVGEAMRSYPSYKVRSSGCALLEQL